MSKMYLNLKEYLKTLHKKKWIKMLVTIALVFVMLLYQSIQLLQLNKYCRVYSARIDNMERHLFKEIHFSIDDTIAIFKDLTENENKYSSIYENPTLRQLKRLHDIYGVKVDLYCFVEYGGFSLKDCTSKFSDQFLEASDWLSFGFHGYSPDIKEYKNADQFEQYYNKFLLQLDRICKGGCTSTVRLEGFRGSNDVLDVLQEKGIDVLLCADSQGRSSYALNDDENDYLWKNGILEKDDFSYWKTDYRLDDIDKTYVTEMLSNSVDDNRVVIFVHESKLTSKFWKWFDLLCEQLILSGYRFI